MDRSKVAAYQEQIAAGADIAALGAPPLVEGFQIDTWCGPDSVVVERHRKDAPSLWRATDDFRGTRYRALTSDTPAYGRVEVITSSGRCFTSVDLIYNDEAERDAELVARLIEGVLHDT